MKRPRVGAVFLLCAVGACAKAPPPPQFAWDRSASFQNLETFAWNDEPPFEMPRGGGTVDGRFIDERLRAAVETNLARKGLRKAASEPPDILVTYHTTPEPLVDRDVYGRYGWWSPYVYQATATEKQATLALDVRTPERKLIWRGVVTRSAAARNPEEIGEAIDAAVETLLAGFPPGSSVSPAR